MSQRIKYVVVHCTATPSGREVTKADIERWHLSPEPSGRGWSRVGYTDLIQLNGELINLTPFDQDVIVQNHEMTWGVKGINKVSRHVVYAGGCDAKMNPKDTRTIQQKKALETYVKYMVLRHPHIKIAGHNQFANKSCPSFDVPKWLRSIGIHSKNIHL
jgi:N-acetylmuramoyl-L-alanine amidase